MRAPQLTVCLIILGAASIVAAQAQTARPKVIFTPVVMIGDPAPGGGIFYKFLYPAGVINDADQIVFQAVAAGNASVAGLYMAQPSGISLIAPGTQDAPGYAPGVQMAGFPANLQAASNHGAVVWESSLIGPGMDPSGQDSANSFGNWFWDNGVLQKIAQFRTPAPGTGPGADFRTFSRTMVNDLGHVAFSGDLIGPNVNEGNDTALWYGTPANLQLIAREGSPAPDGQTYGDMRFDHPFLSPKGKMIFLSGDYTHRTLVAGSVDDLRVVARSDDFAPGTTIPFGNMVSYWNTPKINDDGEVIFASSNGVFAGKTDDISVVAKEGGPAPQLPGKTFDSFYDVSLSAKGEIAFRAGLLPRAGDSSFEAIYAGKPRNTRLLAATGMQAPGVDDGTVFTWLHDPVINKDGQVAFFGNLGGDGSRGINDYGIFATGHNGDLRLIARYGDEFEVRPGDVRTIAAVSDSGVNGSHMLTFNADSNLVFYAKFTDGSEGIFTATVLPEPQAILLGLLALPMLSRRRLRSFIEPKSSMR